jgi:hypothetical protein
MKKVAAFSLCDVALRLSVVFVSFAPCVVFVQASRWPGFPTCFA